MTNWDERYLELAAYVSTWSKDPSKQCGAVIVRPNRTLASVGFNGFAIGCDDDSILYNTREIKLSRVIHAEVNAVLLAMESVVGYTMYSWPPGFGPSCDRCATVVIQAGISRIVYQHDESNLTSNWREACQSALEMYAEAGVEVVAL